MNRAEQMETDKRRHEYTLMEVRLTGEDIKNNIAEKIDKRIKPLEDRVTSLEHWRTLLLGGWGAIIAWFKFGDKLKM